MMDDLKVADNEHRPGSSVEGAREDEDKDERTRQKSICALYRFAKKEVTSISITLRSTRLAVSRRRKASTNSWRPSGTTTRSCMLETAASEMKASKPLLMVPTKTRVYRAWILVIILMAKRVGVHYVMLSLIAILCSNGLKGALRMKMMKPTSSSIFSFTYLNHTGKYTSIDTWVCRICVNLIVCHETLIVKCYHNSGAPQSQESFEAALLLIQSSLLIHLMASHVCGKIET